MAEQITWSLEERIMQVSEMIGNNILESALDFRHGTQQTKSLWDGIEILEPRLAELDELLGGVIQKHKLGDALINAVRNGYSTSGYVVGIIMGMHLSGRADFSRDSRSSMRSTSARCRKMSQGTTRTGAKCGAVCSSIKA